MTASRLLCFWAISICIALSAFSVFAQSAMALTAEQDFSDTELKHLKTCLSLEKDRDACYAEVCEYEPGYLCAEDVLDAMVVVSDPEQAMKVLHEIMASPLFAITSDGHLLSHVIGRATSRTLGPSGEHFLRCPSDFNSGCFHGFFEHTLPEAESPVDVVIAICENMPHDTPAKEKSYCYHGAGHVFMMQESHNLATAIAHCLRIPDNWAESCWQGVFMENAGEREWEMKQKNFRKDDPLYPCNTHPVVEDRFKPECYINHHGYLIRHYSQSWDALVEVCLGAEEFVTSCLGGLGLMLGSPFWIDVVAEDFGIVDKSRAEKFTFFCNRLPDVYIPVCYRHGIPSFLNFGHEDLTTVSNICSLADEQYRTHCFKRIGSYLSILVSNNDEKQKVCSTIPEEYQSFCFDDLHAVKNGANDTVSDTDSSKGDKVIVRFFKALHSFFTRALHLIARPMNASAESIEGDSLYSKVRQCLKLDVERSACYASLCAYDSGFMCAERILMAVVMHDGPEIGMRVLEEMISSSAFSFDGANEGHSLAHTIGRTTARELGATGEMFLRCPTALDYGCQHGFLEHVLPETASPSEAVTNICESLPKVPTIGRSNCYHGSGHGVMMNASYHLAGAFAVCAETPDPFSCYTGVTMENVSGAISGVIRSQYSEHNSFREDNPLAPCDTLTDTQQRKACYRQHMPYLAKYFEYQVQDVADACLSASNRTDVDDCVFGFGAYGVYDHIQNLFLPEFAGDYMDTIIHMCNHFPEEYRMMCYAPAIDVSTVFYRVKRASDFCYKVEKRYERDCFRAIGDRLLTLVASKAEAEQECSVVPEEYRSECLNPHGKSLDIDDEISHDVEFSTDAVEKRGGDRSFFHIISRFLSDILARLFVHLSHPIFAQSEGLDSPQSFHNIRETDSKQCLASERERDVCFASLCAYDPGFLCAEEILRMITKEAGPEIGMEVLDNMVAGDIFSFDPITEGHNLAHVVGRSTAEYFGLSGDAFIRCPSSFAYGCQHGFLEIALQASNGDSAAAIQQICEHMSDQPSLNKVSCYHGGGHGIMMNESHHLYRSLAVCDQLATERSVCYDGVFMEHISGRGRPDVKQHWFDEEDPLAPCNRVEDKYQYACYYRHGNYLFDFHNFSLDAVLTTCLDAGKRHNIESCLTAVSGSILFPHVQERIIPDFDGPFLERLMHLCDRFPSEWQNICVVSSAGELTIFYGVEDALTFCLAAREAHQAPCLEKINERVISLTANERERMAMCASVSDAYQYLCFLDATADPLALSVDGSDTRGGIFPFIRGSLTQLTGLAFSGYRKFLNHVLQGVVYVAASLTSLSSHAHCINHSVWQFVGNFSDVVMPSDFFTLDDHDYFGDAVSLSDDVLAVGAFGDDDGAVDTGAVYLFERQDGERWMPILKMSDNEGGEGLLSVSLQGADRFGRGISLHGNTLAVGAYYDSEKKGAVYLFERGGNGVWEQIVKISDNVGGDGLLPMYLDEGAHFGASVSLYGDILAVGAYLAGNDQGAVYVFERSGDGAWGHSFTIPSTTVSDGGNTAFGRSVSLYENVLAVGAPRGGSDNSGSAYLFRRETSGRWDLLSQFSANTRSDHQVVLRADDHFGSSVSLHDGVLAVGAIGDDDGGVDTGAVYVFEHDDRRWVQMVKLHDGSDSFDGDLQEGGMFGHGISLYKNMMVIGEYKNGDSGNSRGEVYVFRSVPQRACSFFHTV